MMLGVVRRIRTGSERLSDDMAYLKCSHCGLSVRSRNPLTDHHYCPRCRARGRLVALLRSPLPPRTYMNIKRSAARPAG